MSMIVGGGSSNNSGGRRRKRNSISGIIVVVGSDDERISHRKNNTSIRGHDGNVQATTTEVIEDGVSNSHSNSNSNRKTTKDGDDDHIYFQPQFLEDDIDNNTITFESEFEFDDDMVDLSKIKRRDWSTYKRNWKLKCCNCIAIGFIVVMLYLFVQFINYDGPVSFDDDSLELNTK